MANEVMPYAWGSRDGIATLQRRPASATAEAELWMGAHPNAPSTLEWKGAHTALDAAIAADPVGLLGQPCIDRFGARLPFLLKVLAAAEPLSLQVHPDDARAELGFALEEAAGIERTAPHRSYGDPYSKPELLVALTDFHVLQGFRPAADAVEALVALRIDRLDPLIEALRSGAATGAVFLRLLAWPADDRRALVDLVASNPPSGPLGQFITSLAASYPTDPGVVGVLLLNYLVLAPSQGLYVRPGQIHAYLRGMGVEILGGSDNVIRCGLTSKHIALDELTTVLGVDGVAPAVIEPVASPDGEAWPTPQPEFALDRLRFTGSDGGARSLVAHGPTIYLCTEGRLELVDGDDVVALASGESAFASDGAKIEVNGSGVLMRANPGLPW
ncbi:MAG TPA: mannose-6-phosphate isomerase, class I [Acidothermaceae bacterium]|jgi:mannose-6-phosphate isomerase